MAYGLTAVSASQLEGNGGVSITEVPDTALAYVFPLDNYFPDEESPLHDVNVRKALLMAIDREGIAEALYGGHARVAPSNAPTDDARRGRPDVEPVPYDPEEAKRLLDEAGASGITLTLNSYNSTPLDPRHREAGRDDRRLLEGRGRERRAERRRRATILPEWRAHNLRGTGLLAGPAQFYDEPARLLSSFFASDASVLDARTTRRSTPCATSSRRPSTSMAGRRSGAELQTTLDENLYGLPIILVSSLVAVGPNVASFEPMEVEPVRRPDLGTRRQVTGR